jgi:hypothetical protein
LEETFLGTEMWLIQTESNKKELEWLCYCSIHKNDYIRESEFKYLNSKRQYLDEKNEIRKRKIKLQLI